MSTLAITTLQDRVSSDNTPVLNAIHGSAKAWVNFNGTGTVAIRASYNVSSITDNGTGDYTVNFTNAFADANYAAAGISELTVGAGTGGAYVVEQGATAPTTSAFNLRVHRSTVAFADSANIYVAIFR